MKISATQTGFVLYKEADVIGRCGVTPTPKGADITALSVLPRSEEHTSELQSRE